MFQFPNMYIERLASVKVSLLQVNQSQGSIELICDKMADGKEDAWRASSSRTFIQTQKIKILINSIRDIIY